MGTKTCTKCGGTKPLGEFNWKKKGIKRKAQCRSCTQAVSARHYHDNKATYKRRSRAHDQAHKARAQRFVFEYLLKHPCMDCGEADPVVLEFDHRDPATKSMSVANMLRRSWSIARLSEEISKCDVRCANCHRRRTAREFNYYTHRLSEAGS